MKLNYLKLWQELCGTFEHIEINSDVVSATIAGTTLRYSRRTSEAEFLIHHLKRSKIGKKVGILHFDTGFRIRWPKDPVKPKLPVPFWKWYCKSQDIPEEW